MTGVELVSLILGVIIISGLSYIIIRSIYISWYRRNKCYPEEYRYPEEYSYPEKYT
jgi:hypothetical protein